MLAQEHHRSPRGSMEHQGVSVALQRHFRGLKGFAGDLRGASMGQGIPGGVGGASRDLKDLLGV